MIEVSRKGNIALLEIKHGKANTQDMEFCQELIVTFEDLRHSEVKGVVLTGQRNIFSAGVDLLRVLEDGPDYIKEFLPTLSKMFETVFFFPKPVIAAINGHAIAGGCVLACSADYRVMAQEVGKIGVTELLVGLPFPQIALEIMRFVSKPRYFEDLLYTGETFSAENAQECGLVNYIVPQERLIEHAVEVAETFGAVRPEAFALTKRQVRAPVLKQFLEGFTSFEPRVVEMWSNQEAARAMQDYISRTFKKS